MSQQPAPSLTFCAALLSASSLLLSCGVFTAASSDASKPPSSSGEATTSPTPPNSMPLRLSFDQPEQKAGSVVTRVTNSGDADLSISVVTADGGRLRWLNQHGQAIRTPEYRATDSEPRALLSVRNAGGDADALSPGDASFSFGADFALDAVSDGSSVDNGDNLIQRGLATDEVQYKLELDNRRPSCRILGSTGDVRVVSPVQVRAGAWYRVRCLRHPASVTLTVTDLATGKETVTTEAGETGLLDASSRSIPLSVGGKLNSDGSLVQSATDQFNGAIDQVMLSVR